MESEHLFRKANDSFKIVRPLFANQLEMRCCSEAATLVGGKLNYKPTKQDIYSATDPVGIGVKFETEFAGSSARSRLCLFCTISGQVTAKCS